MANTQNETPKTSVTRPNGHLNTILHTPPLVINFTDVNFNYQQLNLLKRGIKYTPICPTDHLSIYLGAKTFISRMYNHIYFQSKPPQTAPTNIITQASTFTADLHDDHVKTLERFMLNTLHVPTLKDNTHDNKTVMSLRNKNVVYTKADKSNTLCIFTINDYISMLNKHLNDVATYTKVSDRVLCAIQDDIIVLANKYKSILTSKEYTCLTKPNIIRNASFYILPKIHKSDRVNDVIQRQDNVYMQIELPNDLSSRPIVNNINCPTSKLSEMLHILLKPFLTVIPSYIKDTRDFLSKLPKSVSPNDIFVTLDIISLYTNIPHELGYMAVIYWITHYPHLLDDRFTCAFIIESLRFVLENNIFTANKQIYKQTHGTAMGTKVAPVYANLTIGFIENTIYTDVNIPFVQRDYIHTHLMRYLDDCFIICDTSIISPSQIKDILNSVNSHIQYTSTHSATTINFLDVTIMNKHFEILTDLYVKPTSNFSYIPFYSYHPSHIKRNIPYTLAQRIYNIVSDENLRKKRFDQLQHNLVKLHYPKQLIRDAIKRANTPKSQNVTSVPKKILPFISMHSQSCTQFYRSSILPFFECMRLYKPFSHYLNQCNVILCRRQPPNMLRLLQHFSIPMVKKCNSPRCKTCASLLEYKRTFIHRHKSSTLNVSSSCDTQKVIYLLICDGCQKAYIGRTSVQFRQRLTLHRQHINTNYGFLPVSLHIKTCAPYTFSTTIIYNYVNDTEKTAAFIEEFYIDHFEAELNVNATA